MTRPPSDTGSVAPNGAWGTGAWGTGAWATNGPAPYGWIGPLNLEAGLFGPWTRTLPRVGAAGGSKARQRRRDQEIGHHGAIH
ncbi:MAG: hypothetical protein WA797_00155, partial [Acidimicrobiales bacterium]